MHDDVTKWKHFSRYLPFVRGLHRWPVIAPHRGQWRGALMFSLIWAWINGWVNTCESSDLRRNHAHYDVTVMEQQYITVCLYDTKRHVYVHMHQWTESSLVRAMACPLFGVKPLLDTRLTYRQLEPPEQNSVKTGWKENGFSQENAFDKVVCKMSSILCLSVSTHVFSVHGNILSSLHCRRYSCRQSRMFHTPWNRVPGIHFTNGVWAHAWNLVKIHVALILIKRVIPTGHNFAHVTTAQLSWHVQNGLCW